VLFMSTDAASFPVALDTPRFVRDWERALQLMWDVYASGASARSMHSSFSGDRASLSDDAVAPPDHVRHTDFLSLRRHIVVGF
jgi:hypothetical protein